MARIALEEAGADGDSYSLSDPYLFVYASFFELPGMGHPDRFPLVRAHRQRVRARPATARVLAAEGLADW